ncbi:uncharacterized protein J3D65DRAFT_565196 [Phyllosticta citribraziliensis]|uniref:Diaminohydroxyphosphoribosylamino-pyrimidine deaminase n=1 Tax=Phyllosticta citribraziliensis TaxID=989973 RepID=A0ABR1M375_9PEZI
MDSPLGAFCDSECDKVSDPEEDAFVVFSQDIPSHALGIVDPKSSTLDISVAGRDYTIQQSLGLLTSNRAQGSTGAVVWKVTPLFAQYIAARDNFLFQSHALTASSTVLELGCGVAGIVPLALAPHIGRYIATDQDYVLKLLRQNIAENSNTTSSSSGSKRAKPADVSAGKIETATLDWETDSVEGLFHQLNLAKSSVSHGGVDAVVACDCIYNEALVEPFVNTCAEVCAQRAQVQGAPPTYCIIAQQLRTYEVFERWLVTFHKRFRVWKISDSLLSKELKENSGFIVHIGILR